jgi:transposase
VCRGRVRNGIWGTPCRHSCTPDHPPTPPKSAGCGSSPRPATRPPAGSSALAHHRKRDGARVADLARRLDCHPKTVSKWLHRFNTSGIDGLADLPRPGVPRRISEHQRGRILALARSAPPGRLHQGGEGLVAPDQPEAPAHWTLDALAQAAQAEGIAVGRSQVRWILLAERVRWRRTRSWATSTDPDFAPKGAGHCLLHQPAAGHDRGLRRRARPGDPSQLPARARLDPGRPPGQGTTGLRPRAGEDLGLRRAAGPRWADGHPHRTLTQLGRLPGPPGCCRDCQPGRGHHGDHRQPLQPHQRLDQDLADRPPPHPAHLHPQGCLLAESLQEGWWRLFRREAFAGQSFATPEEITLATSVATCQLNARARPWVWAARYRPRATDATPSPTGSKERSTSDLWSPASGRLCQVSRGPGKAGAGGVVVDLAGDGGQRGA